MQVVSTLIAMALGIVVAACVVGFLASYPLMLLWNLCLVPAVPVLQEVTWLQMWGISILFSLLFKSSSVSSS